LLNMSSFNGDLGQDYYRGAGEAWGAGEYGLSAGCALTGLCETTYSLVGTFLAVYGGLYVAQMVGVAIYGYASQLWRGGGISNGNNLTTQSVLNKLENYLLNPNHPLGSSKARWFESALGYNKNNMAGLAKQIVFNETHAVQTGITQYGVKFNQIISIIGANGRVIDVNTAWIRNNDGIIRFITAIPTKP